MKHVLFLCSRNRLRSPTAESVFADIPGITTDSAGLADDADTPLEEDQVLWADLILVMETVHKTRLKRKFGHLLAQKQIGVLRIKDQYEFMQEELVVLLRTRCAQYFR